VVDIRKIILLRLRKWMHYDGPPIVKYSVIGVDVEHLAKPSARMKKSVWLWWPVTECPDISRCRWAYLLRLRIEHPLPIH
jgi:hypothetical protein